MQRYYRKARPRIGPFCFLKSMMRLVAGDIAALDSFTLALLHAALVVALLMRVDVFCDWRT